MLHGFLERLDVEKPQGTQMVGHRAGRQLLHREELGLVFPNMSRAEAIGESSGKCLRESFPPSGYSVGVVGL